MSLQSVRQFFAEHAPDIEIIELNQSTATVALAAAAHNVEPGQIAKTLSLKIKDKIVLIVARGDARLDNKKLKETFGAKARMLSSDEVVTWTGHPVGGVCPFGLEIRWPSIATSRSGTIRRCYPQREPFTAPFVLNQNDWRSSPMRHG